ncbi:MAG: DUF488 family protein [Myxococcaceae bacterium]|nr:DUF488 family protein [Myxococcaceae bacterium]
MEPDDGERILVCRYRPRGLPKEQETWHTWLRDLGPSPELFADFKGKHGPNLTLSVYKARYAEEMKGELQMKLIQQLADRVDAGETITLLCSKDCFLPEACHRSVLAELIEAARPSRANAARASMR